MSGATFTIGRGDGTTGIAVGTVGEFPAMVKDAALQLAERFGPTDMATRQGYILRTHAKGAQIIVASELAVVYGGVGLPLPAGVPAVLSRPRMGDRPGSQEPVACGGCL
jgi:hypothetical protein